MDVKEREFTRTVLLTVAILRSYRCILTHLQGRDEEMPKLKDTDNRVKKGIPNPFTTYEALLDCVFFEWSTQSNIQDAEHELKEISDRIGSFL